MDKQEYLNRLSADIRPEKPAGKFSRILSSKIFLVCLFGLIGLIFIIIIGSILSGLKGSQKDKIIAFKLHLDNTSEIMEKYQKNIKSSILRSNSASLSSIISDTNNSVSNYLKEKYDFKEKNIPQKITDQATLEKDELESSLAEAKINGMLDRTYANKMAYEISMFTTEENQIYNSIKDEPLKETLGKSINSLNNLYHEFNGFLETK